MKTVLRPGSELTITLTLENEKLQARIKELERSQTELAMLVQRLTHRFNKADPNNLLSQQARDYLRRNGLDGMPIREQEKTKSPIGRPQPRGYEQRPPEKKG